MCWCSTRGISARSPGLGFMLEPMDEPELALQALEAAQELNPNRPNVNEAVTRLEKMTGDAEL